MNARWRIVTESVGAAVVVYIVAGGSEAALIRAIHPTELELAWVSDIVLSAALGVAVYLWRHLLASRRELAERERAALVIQTQLSVAAEMQRHFLPAVPPAAEGFDWAATLVSAGKVGGDFYDFVEHPAGTWLVLVADVSGRVFPRPWLSGHCARTSVRSPAIARNPRRFAAALSAAVRDEWQGAPYVT